MKKIYCLVIFVMLTAVNNRLYSQTYEDQSKYPTESSQNILSLGPIGYCAIGGGGVVFAYLIWRTPKINRLYLERAGVHPDPIILNSIIFVLTILGAGAGALMGKIIEIKYEPSN